MHEEPLLHTGERLGVPHPVEHGPPERVVYHVRLTSQAVWSPGSTGEERLQEQEVDLVIRG
jgi:hypothetical protein